MPSESIVGCFVYFEYLILYDHPALRRESERRRKMAAATLERGPIAATESERPALARIKDLFESHDDQGPRLITAEGEVIELPDSLVRVVRQVINALSHDQAVSVVPVHKQLTTQQA